MRLSKNATTHCQFTNRTGSQQLFDYQLDAFDSVILLSKAGFLCPTITKTITVLWQNYTRTAETSQKQRNEPSRV